MRQQIVKAIFFMVAFGVVTQSQAYVQYQPPQLNFSAQALQGSFAISLGGCGKGCSWGTIQQPNSTVTCDQWLGFSPEVSKVMYQNCVYNNLRKLEEQFVSGIIPQLVNGVNYVIDQQGRLGSEVLASVSGHVREQIRAEVIQEVRQSLMDEVRAEVRAEMARLKGQE